MLITGETGTGKGVLAAALHKFSGRAGSFVAVNCRAVPEGLVASELFGHEAGAFTGAGRRRKGRFEQAHRGTIFLDEIVDLDDNAQSSLLTVLDDMVFYRVGGEHLVHVDARVVAATNGDVERLVGLGKFREDLLYRLNVHRIHLAPLRERPECVAVFAREFARAQGFELAENAVAFLQALPLPGNARELRTRIERAAVGRRGVLCADALRAAGAEVAGVGEAPAGREGNGDLRLRPAMLALRRRLCREALAQSNGNVAQAANLLGVRPQTLHALLEKLGLSSPSRTGAK